MAKINNGLQTKVYKNNVSYFIAGFIACMVWGGRSKKDIGDYFYRGIGMPNLVKEFLKAYDEKDNDTDGLDYMQDYVIKKSKNVLG
jgi:hypothetical protein